MDETTIIKIYNEGLNAVIALIQEMHGQIVYLTKHVECVVLMSRVTSG